MTEHRTGHGTRSLTWQVVLARVRFPLLLGGAVLLVFGESLGLGRVARLALFLTVSAVALRGGTVRRPPITVAAPVAGCWQGLNSPATRVPSHGTQEYGQTYAIDLVHKPQGDTRPSLVWWPPTRRPQAFSAFGQPVYAAADGVVVRAHGRERDHWSRNSWPALTYLLPEMILRGLTGPGRVFGNHLVIDHGDGSYAAYAHLRRGSLRVAHGERVEAGQHLADCGNSGNTTEPHLHFQLMDHPRPLVAAGLPVNFDHFKVDGESATGMPANKQCFVATSAQDLATQVSEGPTGGPGWTLSRLTRTTLTT